MPEERLAPGSQTRVHLVKPDGDDIEYPMDVLRDDGNHLVVRGTWSLPDARDLGYTRFEPGDVFTEHYWRDRWYSVKEVRAATGARKGWYCDVTRPVRVRDGVVISEDLYLDLWASADGATVLRLDEGDFAASGLSDRDPAAAEHALAALDELEHLAHDRFEAISTEA